MHQFKFAFTAIAYGSKRTLGEFDTLEEAIDFVRFHFAKWTGIIIVDNNNDKYYPVSHVFKSR